MGKFYFLFMQLTDDDEVPSDNDVPPSSDYVPPSDDEAPPADDDVPSYYGVSSVEEEEDEEQEQEDEEQEDEEPNLPPSAFTEEPDWRGIDEDSERVCYHGLSLRRKVWWGGRNSGRRFLGCQLEVSSFTGSTSSRPCSFALFLL
jgi:hypothetical protein